MTDVVVLGKNICTLSRPTNAVRWVIRGRVERVLQQAWVVTSDQGNTTYSHQEWRDVPTEAEAAGDRPDDATDAPLS